MYSRLDFSLNGPFQRILRLKCLSKCIPPRPLCLLRQRRWIFKVLADMLATGMGIWLVLVLAHRVQGPIGPRTVTG